MDEIIRTIAVYALPVLFAITVHEAAHAYAAKHFGDATAFVAGRMTLNPIKHIDPIGTVLVPLVLLVAQSSFMFGWAKPVPVVESRLRNTRRDMAWVALAGPMANLVMALLWLILSIVCQALAVSEPFPNKVALAGFQFNLILFAFNLMPILPLDGGRVLAGFLPKQIALRYGQIEQYGMYIVLALIIFNVAGYWVGPVAELGAKSILLLTSPFH